MHIHCNGKKQSIDKGYTLAQLLSQHKLEPETVVVEINKQIIEFDQYPTLKLKDGDTVELIRFVGGG
jgi:sulfur carrier protein